MQRRSRPFTSDAPRMAVVQRPASALSLTLALALALTLTLTLFCAGCDTKAEVDADGPQTPAACLTVGNYGNGTLCEDTVVGREKCGSSETRLCAAGWLCLDDARSAFCTCKVDSDCARRAVYINHGRALRKMAPIGPKCVAGRCVGLP